MVIFEKKIKTKSDENTPNCTALKISRRCMTPHLSSNAHSFAMSLRDMQIRKFLNLNNKFSPPSQIPGTPIYLHNTSPC